MALEGTLESFAIAEIFQLIATQSKTGILIIETEDNVARIRFVHGQVLDAYPGDNDPNRFIGAMLVRSGLVTERQLEYALGVQKRSLRKLGDILIRMGALRTNEFQEMLTLQRRELTYNLLRLRRGKYKFDQADVEYESEVDELLNVDALLMEGSRQIDEWPSILKRIPSEGRVYKRVEGVSPVREMTDEEVVTLGLVDGTMTVREIVDKSRLGEFSCWDAMSNLYDDGLIAPVEVKKRRVKVKRPEIKITKESPRYIDAMVGLILTVAAVFVLITPNLLTSPLEMSLSEALAEASVDLANMRERINQWQYTDPFVPEIAGEVEDAVQAEGESR